MNEPITIDLELLLPYFIIQGILVVAAVIDWIKQEGNMRGNQWVWLVVIVLVTVIGPILYFLFGRKRKK